LYARHVSGRAGESADRSPLVPRPPLGGYAARYYPAHGPELIVELWDEGKGFTLELCYEADYPLWDGSIEALTVGLGRYECDTFLDQYYRLLGPLEHFTRAKPVAVGRRVS
jgi:hypothetical protein